MLVRQVLHSLFCTSQQVFFHGHNLKSLHKYVDPMILPKEYGGVKEELDDTAWREKLLELDDWFAGEALISHFYAFHIDSQIAEPRISIAVFFIISASSIFS